MAHIRPIKILFLHPADIFYGAERISYNLLKNINKELFEVTLITSKSLSPQFSFIPSDSILSLEGIGLSLYFSNSTSFSKDVRVVADILKSNAFDIAFGMMHYASSLLACAKKIYHPKIKVISSPRGSCNIFLHECIKSEERAFYKILFTLFCHYSDGLIVPSNGVKDECVLNFGAKSEKVAVINNSVDLRAIQQKSKEQPDMPFPDDFFLISTACRLSQEKNLSFLIKVFSELRKKLKVKLLIIGDGPEKADLQALCKGLNLTDEVYFTGFQENPFKYIAASDVFVHTCLFEGFGNAIIEAMACKVPVVATACPYGPIEIIENGENGILVGMNDSEGMKQAIKALLVNREMRKVIYRKGFQTASKYTIEKMVNAYESFFCAMAGE